MPGEMINAPVEPIIGAVVTNEELELLLLRNRANAHQLCAYQNPDGDRYTVAFLERAGFAVYSHQDARVWVFELADMVRLAKAAGMDKETPRIVLPGSEVRRG